MWKKKFPFIQFWGWYLMWCSIGICLYLFLKIFRIFFRLYLALYYLDCQKSCTFEGFQYKECSIRWWKRYRFQIELYNKDVLFLIYTFNRYWTLVIFHYTVGFINSPKSPRKRRSNKRVSTRKPKPKCRKMNRNISAGNL